MIRRTKSLGDRLVGRLIGSVDAGACVQNAGELCSTTYSHTTCSEHVKTTRYYYYAHSCTGPCTDKSGVATGRVDTSHC
ncbi:MAG: hypothetical protein JWO76_1951 [Nocardioides sp.]|nr:hypothetical protein [Nocardioides sp.]